MDNKIQNYDWGSRSAIHDLFGFANDDHRPQAEVWMGTHPNGCSSIEGSDVSLSLADLIQHDQVAFLSEPTAKQYGDLPFLFKILSAERAPPFKFIRVNAMRKPVLPENSNWAFHWMPLGATTKTPTTSLSWSTPLPTIKR